MQLTLNDENTKALLTEILVDLLRNEKALFNRDSFRSVEGSQFCKRNNRGAEKRFNHF